MNEEGQVTLCLPSHSVRARPYPQPWVQVQACIEQLIIIVIFVFPLTDNLMDGRGEANESWGTEEK